MSIIGIITLVFLLADAWLELGVWLSRIHFGRWSDRGEWQRALERKARDYLKHSPTVRKTEQTRLVLIDMLQGNFRSKAIQSWQDAGLILGLDEKDAVGYAGHHPNLFKRKDIRHINEVFASLPGPKMVITTEKDAVRLQDMEDISKEVRENIYKLPIKVSFMLDQEEEFNHKITGYVRKNSRNSILVKAKDEHKPKDSHHTGNGPRTISFRNN